MGRILKKKDPIKKKVQRTAGGDNSTEASKNGENAAVIKTVPVMRKSAASEKSKVAPVLTSHDRKQVSQQGIYEIGGTCIQRRHDAKTRKYKRG